MAEIIKQKSLSEGTLALKEYFLDKSSAEALERPIGSRERIIVFIGEYNGRTSSPRASWYLHLEDYLKTFGIIKKREDVNLFFARIKDVIDNKTANTYRDFLSTYSKQ